MSKKIPAVLPKITFMCAYHTWFYCDKIGYVIECLDCNHIQLCFGNLQITFEMSDFDMFKKYIQKSTEQILPCSDRHVKSITLKTPCTGINMILSESELHGLHEMIDFADTEMRSSALLNLFYNKPGV